MNVYSVRKRYVIHSSVPKYTAQGTLTKTTSNWHTQNEQEAQLMLTNPRDAFGGQSRSPNIVPMHMLGIFPLVQ